MDEYLSGQRLYGDDLAPDQIERWFRDEAEAYYEMSGDSQSPEHYGYSELNRQTLLSHIEPERVFRHGLGFGSGFGTELVPLAARIERLSVLESTENYGRDPRLEGHSVQSLAAQPSGDIAIPDRSVDLISCLGVLHHIPNVSHILREFGRILEPGGVLLLREPIISMGNWATPREGLTTHERGIPYDTLMGALAAAGLRVEHEAFVIFPPIMRLWRIWTAPYNSRALTALDRAACCLTRWNHRYHATRAWHKLRPTNLAVVAIRV